MKNRARELGIPFDGTPGKNNAITDVAGVEVGLTTVIAGDQNSKPGEGPIRTGVTIIKPRGKDFDPVFGASSTLNGNGEVTGLCWLEESGFIENPIGITTTHSVGVVRDSIIDWVVKNKFYIPTQFKVYWSMPVVGETWDGRLNDYNGGHVKKEHVFSALDNTKGGKVPEGNVGGGTGMVLHHYKGGTCTSSRVLTAKQGGYTVGVLAQANYGERRNLTIAGVPVGKDMKENLPQYHSDYTSNDVGSIIVVVATDAPLLPHQLKRLCRRVPMGLARLGGYGANSSGDIFLAFSTANKHAFQRKELGKLEMISNDEMDPIFEATVQAVEEALVNCLCAAETMTGLNGTTVHAMPQDKLLSLLKKYNRI